MPQSMRPKTFRESGSASALDAGMPYRFVCHRPLSICFLESRGKQVDLRLHFASSPVRPQRVEQLRCEWQFPIARVLTLMDVDNHSLAVDIGKLQLGCLGSPKTGSVQKQQDG